MKLETICKKCGRKMEPIFRDHVYTGKESIMNGTELIRNGTENIMTGREVRINDYKCPFCGEHHDNGLAREKK